jgi:leucine dehydrogenase
MVDETESGVGDLNRATAIGVEAGARVALRFCLGIDNWKGIRVAIQGAGGVGQWLARILSDEGADLAVSDLNEKTLERLAEQTSFEAVGPEEIYSASRDVFCPCAVGSVLNDETVDRLTARVVAGSANNVLSEPSIGKTLHQLGICYVPDSLISAGALIQGIRFLLTGERESRDAIAQIGEKTHELLATAASSQEPPCHIFERDTRRKIGPQRSWRRWAWPSI